MSDDDLIRRGDAREALREVDAWTMPIAHAINALPAVTVGVRPLVWEEGVSTYPYAMGGRVRYQLGRGDDGWAVHIGIAGKPIAGPFDTAEAAKAAAQADYEDRILAALEPVAAPDPAAIREAFLGTCSCGMTGPCMWDQCKHPLAKGAADDRA